MIHALKEKSGPMPAKGVTPNTYIAICGTESKQIDAMTAWSSEVTCRKCAAIMVAAAERQNIPVNFVVPR